MSVKKLVSILFALALITGLMAACASPTPTTAPAPATQAPAAPATSAPVQPTATTAAAPVTLSYLVSQGWAPDAEIALAKKFA